MSIHLGQELTSDCRPVAAGTVLRLLKAKCETEHLKLRGFGPPRTPQLYQRVPCASRRNGYTMFEREHGITVCNPAFAVKDTIHRMSVRNDLVGLHWTFTSDYNEATNPFNGNTSPQTIKTGVIEEGQTTIDFTYTTGSSATEYLGSPSSMVGTAHIHVDFILNGCSNFIRYTATLGSFGYPYEILYGTPVIYVQETGMPNPSFTTSCGYFWTGAGYFDNEELYVFPHTGLVMSMYHRITFELPPPPPGPYTI